jgi:Ca2+-transporting ATPase
MAQSAEQPATLSLEPCHSQTASEIATQLHTDLDQGLSAEEVKKRQDQYGRNELVTTSGRSSWEVLLDQFTNVMLLMLLGVAVVSAYLDLTDGNFPKDAIAILAIVALNGLLGYLQESRAEKALMALKKLSSPIVRVRRNGTLSEIAATELVPGDVVLLEAGVQIPADGRLWNSVNLQVREAALTGEAMPVSKQAQGTLASDTPLGDRTNMVFQGTEVVQGRGKAIVTSIGMATELGKVASLLESVENEATPLQKRMDQLGNVLVSGALALVVVVVVLGIIRTGDFSNFRDLLVVSLSMAVAVVPEGLPAVITVTLAIGTQRMVHRQALIRRLPAVETLGSVTTICSDKTGTLTENKMVVTAVETAQAHYTVTGTGYVPEGEFYRQGQRVDPTQCLDLATMLLAGVVCNDATLQQGQLEPQQGKQAEPQPLVWTILGDPTEGALLTLGGKANLFKSHLEEQLVRTTELPFSSERKRMTVVVQPTAQGSALAQELQLLSGPYLVFCKGSPELILELCNRIQVGDTIQPLEPQHSQEILKANEAMAGQGIRVLGMATAEVETLPPPESLDKLEQDLIWLGLVGMRDAPRAEAKTAVEECKQAGIRPMMITGDHRLTARAVARDLGIAQDQDEVMEGRELAKLGSDQLADVVQRVNVYARVAPEHKLWIVQALQKQNQFVAMTGDGVNDAPALKQANIGVAMGITGTDVSKEASDMVLLNDNFATIVAAIEEGRIVYSNIRRFIKYILGSNIGEVLTIAAAPLLGIGDVPLTPLQILWMNLVTDGLPALALALEPAEEGVMHRPPVNPSESIFARGMGAYMVRIGIIFAFITITMMMTIWPQFSHWKTMIFTTLCIAQMGHALAVRSNTKLIVEMPIFTNPYLYWAVGLTTLLQLALIYVPVLRQFFGTEVLTWQELLICLGFSSLVMIWVEGEKLFLRIFFPKRLIHNI